MSVSDLLFDKAIDLFKLTFLSLMRFQSLVSLSISSYLGVYTSSLIALVTLTFLTTFMVGRTGCFKSSVSSLVLNVVAASDLVKWIVIPKLFLDIKPKLRGRKTYLTKSESL
jgi:hypothetical protein